MTELSLENARTIISAARLHGSENGFSPLTVVVLDKGGNVLAAEREDGSSSKRYEVAYGKAHGAIALGIGSRAIMTRAEQQPFFIAAVTHAVGALIPVPGGVIVAGPDGKALGAVGITGETSDNDEAAAVQGIIATGYTPVTG